MTPDELLTLETRYAKALYLAERFRQEAEVLHSRLVAAARTEAMSMTRAKATKPLAVKHATPAEPVVAKPQRRNKQKQLKPRVERAG